MPEIDQFTDGVELRCKIRGISNSHCMTCYHVRHSAKRAELAETDRIDPIDLFNKSRPRIFVLLLLSKSTISQIELIAEVGTILIPSLLIIPV